METDNTDTVQATYTYSPWGDGVATGGKDLISMSRASVSSYYHFDGLGSVVALSDVNNVIVERYLYDVFGNTTIKAPDGSTRTTSAFGNRFMFTGREYDNEALMGLYYYRARYYRPSIGRFTSRDLVIVSCLAGIVESIPF
jgi:RHS repeat-associated protein